jgi:hypothetical protein
MGCCFAKPRFTPGPQGWDTKSVWNYLTDGNPDIRQVDMKDIDGKVVWLAYLRKNKIVATSFCKDPLSFTVKHVNIREFSLHGNICKKFAQTSFRDCLYLFKFKVGKTNFDRKCRKVVKVSTKLQRPQRCRRWPLPMDQEDFELFL